MDGSIVEYLYSPSGPHSYKCGYCKSPDTSMTQGVWAYKMSSRDFQDLVDRGFQRSGKYVYRPVMQRTCCPQYVIRLDATKFHMSKAQRKTVKKMKRYIVNGLTSAVSKTEPAASGISAGEGSGEHTTPMEAEGSRGSMEGEIRPVKADTTDVVASQPLSAPGNPELRVHDPNDTNNLHEYDDQTSSSTESKHTQEGYATVGKDLPVPAVSQQDKSTYSGKSHAEKHTKVPMKLVRKGAGPDPTKPLCRKAKIMRRERKAQKQQQEGKLCENAVSVCNSSPPLQPFKENLEELLAIPHAMNNAHQFSTRLVCCSPRCEKFEQTFHESYTVFQKFQMQIHKEKPEDCAERHFTEFLVDSPLRMEDSPPGMPGYGSYHLQYLISGRIFAVGVLDILPRGVVCEYLYYDPAYRFIAPGVYTALQEIMLTQKYYQHNSDMMFYYMGFYVQSCPKMNYKARYAASSLLCPETYHYVPIESCIPKLLISEYSRLADEDVPNGDPKQFSEDGLDRVMVIADMTIQLYQQYRLRHGNERKDFMEEYVRLVGLDVASRVRVFLGRMFF